MKFYRLLLSILALTNFVGLYANEITFDTNQITIGSGISLGNQVLGYEKFDGSPNYNNFYDPDHQLNEEMNLLPLFLEQIEKAPGKEIRISFAHDLATQHTDGYISFDNEGNIILNVDAFDMIENIIDQIQRCGKSVVLCLFHHTWPTDKDQATYKNGFADDAYTQQWIQFAKEVVDRFGVKIEDEQVKVDQWIPFNEPTGYVAAAYMSKKYPPYISFDRNSLGGKAMQNICKAEIEIAKYVKENNPDAQIYRVEQVRPLLPARWWHPLDRLCAHLGNYLAVDSAVDYFKTGGVLTWGLGSALLSKCNWMKRYRTCRPLFNLISSGYVDHTHEKILREIGILVSYYSVNQMRGTKPQPLPNCPTSDKGDAIYPQGLRIALDKFTPLVKSGAIKALGIGEMGCNLDPEKNDPNKISQVYKDLFAEAHQYIKDGGTLIKIHLWSTINTLQWPHPGEELSLSHYGITEKTQPGECLEEIGFLMDHGHFQHALPEQSENVFDEHTPLLKN